MTETENSLPENTKQDTILSRSLEIKAAITQFKSNDKEAYEVVIYQWKQKLKAEESESIWEKVAGPYICDSELEANNEAQKYCDLFSGEIPEGNIPESLTELIEKKYGKNYQFLQPKHFTYQNSEDLRILESPIRLLSIEEFFLLEYEGFWSLGIAEENKIKTWEKFSDIKQSLEALKKLT